MAKIRGWIASSLDGYIATKDGGLDWLTKYDSADEEGFGYERFIATVGTVVMGRATYDWLAAQDGVEWPYAEKRAIVVTSRPLEEPIGKLETWSQGVDSLIAYLRELEDGDVWMAGGGQLQQAFIERDALDTLEIFIMPDLIGSGIPLFPETDAQRTVSLVTVEQMAAGCVRMMYDFEALPAEM